MNDNLEVIIKARLDESASSNAINSDLANIQNRLKELDLKISLDNSSLAGLQGQLKDLGDQIQTILKGNFSGGELWTGNLRNEITMAQNAAKQGIITLDQLQQKLLSIRETYGQIGAFSGLGGAQNDKLMTNAILQAEQQRTQILQQEQKNRIAIENQEVQQRIALEKEYNAWWQTALKDQESMEKAHYQGLKINEQLDVQNQRDAIQQQLQEIKTFYDAKLTSAQESLTQIKALMEQETAFFQENQDKRLQALKQAATYESSMSAEQNTASSTSSGGRLPGMLGLAGIMASYSGLASIFEDVKKGITDIQTQQAGLQQTLGDQITSQSQLNDVTNQFIDIAQKYGTSIGDVLDAAKLWTRQYSEEISQVLTTNSTMLSIIDNLSVKESNQALESSLNAFQIDIKNTNDAMVQSQKLVDSWTNVSHHISVTAADLTSGFEAAAAAAHVAGLSTDQLNSLIAATVRSTGQSGSQAGTAWKSILTTITSDTPKVEKAFQELGVQLTTVGQDGQKKLRPIYDVILDLTKAAQTATPEQLKFFDAISGGKYQIDRLLASLSNGKTIQDAYNASVDSQGKSAELAGYQLHTMQAELNRLHDAIQSLANGTNQGGLGEFLKTTVVLITDFINGLQKLPPAVGYVGAGFLGIVLAGKAFTSSLELIKNTLEGTRLAITALSNPVQTLTNIFPKQATAVNQTTKELAALTVAEEANVVASDEQVVKSTAMVAANEAVTESVVAETAAYGALDVASAGLTLVIGGIVTVLAGVITAFGSTTDSTQQLDVANQQLMQTYMDHKNQVDQLVNTYDNLSTKTNLTTQEHQQLNDVQNQLNTLMPSLTSNVDAQGQAHLKNADAIKQEIAQAQQLAQLEAQKTQAQKDQGIDDSNSSINKLNKTINADKSPRANMVSQGDGVYVDVGETTKQQSDRLTELANSEEQLSKAYDDITTKINDNVKANLTLNGSYDSLSTASQQYLQNLAQQTEQSLQNATSDNQRTQIYNNTIDSITKQGTAIADATTKLAQLNKQYQDPSNATYQKQVDALTSSLLKAGVTEAQVQTIMGQHVATAKALTDGTIDLQQMQTDLSGSFDTTSKNVDDLNQAIDKLNNKQQLTMSEITNLIKNHSDLIGSIENVNGHWSLNTDALTKVRNALIDQTDTTLSSYKTQLQAQEEYLKALLANYGVQLDAIKTVADAEAQAANISQQAVQATAPKDDSDPQAWANYENRLKAQGSYADSLNSKLSAYVQAKNLLQGYQNALTSGLDPTTSTNTSTKSPSASSVSQPYTNDINAMNEAISPYQNKIKSLDSDIASLNNQQKIYNDLLKSGSSATNIASSVTDEFNKKITDLRAEQNALSQDNNQLRASRNQVEEQMNKLNPSGDITSQSQGIQNAYKALSDEYTKLSQQIDQNGSKWWSNQDAISQSTTDWLNSIIQLQNNGLKPLDGQLKDNDTSIQTLKSHMSLLTNEMKHGGDFAQLMTQYMSDFNQEVKLLTDSNQKLNTENATLGFNNDVLQSKQTDLNNLFNSGKITLESYTSGMSTLNTQIEANNDKIAQNTQKMNQNKESLQAEIDTINQMNFDNADAGIKSILENFTDMTKQIDQEISQMDYQNQLDDNNTKLTQLQAEADKVKNSTSVQSRKTYEDYLKQIADLQKTMSRDAQKKDLEDQKTHIQSLIDIYSNFANNAQSINDVLEKTRQAAGLETNTILKGYLDDLGNKLEDLKNKTITASAQMIQQMNQAIIQAKALWAIANATGDTAGMATAAAQANYARSQGGTIGSDVPLSQVAPGASNSDLQQILANAGSAWKNATSSAARDAIHNSIAPILQASGASYNNTTGTWTSKDGTVLNGTAHLDTGGQIPRDGFAYLHQSEIVINPPLVEKLKNLVNQIPDVNIPKFMSPIFNSDSTKQHAVQIINNFKGMLEGAIISDKTDLNKLSDQLATLSERKVTARLRGLGLQR